ncbi:MAG: hypothetical protein AAF702_15885 [Chloroflexota bacterium]
MNNLWKQTSLHNSVSNMEEQVQQIMLDPTQIMERSEEFSLELDAEALPGILAKAGLRAGQRQTGVNLKTFFG